MKLTSLNEIKRRNYRMLKEREPVFVLYTHLHFNVLHFDYLAKCSFAERAKNFICNATTGSRLREMRGKRRSALKGRFVTFPVNFETTLKPFKHPLKDRYVKNVSNPNKINKTN